MLLSCSSSSAWRCSLVMSSWSTWSPSLDMGKRKICSSFTSLHQTSTKQACLRSDHNKWGAERITEKEYDTKSWILCMGFGTVHLCKVNADLCSDVLGSWRQSVIPSSEALRSYETSSFKEKVTEWEKGQRGQEFSDNCKSMSKIYKTKYFPLYTFCNQTGDIRIFSDV